MSESKIQKTLSKIQNLFDTLPHELQISIYEFDASHRQRFIPSLRQIPFKGMKKRIDYISNMYQRQDYCINYWTNFEELLDLCVQDKEYMIKILSTCTCCVRHQRSRPYNSNYFGISLHDASYSIGIQNLNNHVYGCKCQCECRHMSRWLWKIMNDHSSN